MHLVIDNFSIPVTAANIKWAQSTAADFSVSVPASLLDWENARFTDVELWHRGKLFVKGFVYDSPQLALDDDKGLVVTLGCLDNLGHLTRKRAKSDAHYQDILVTIIIQDLLGVTSDWAIGDTTTMVDVAATTTIDLRAKEHLWAQLIGLAESVPYLFFRYGGYNAALDKHLLDVGNFNNETSRFVQGHNITSIRLQKSGEIPYTVVEAYGGKLSTRKATLQDALTYPGILAHPDYATYPIQLDPLRGTYIVQDLTPGKVGNEITKSFNSNKTKNDTAPTAAEIAAAGFGLWRSTVRFLQQNTQYQTYTVSGTLSSPPQVSDRAWLQGSASEPVYDPLTDSFSWHQTFDVAKSFRITRVELNFQDSFNAVDPLTHDVFPTEKYTVELSDNDYADPADDAVELYGKLQRTDDSDDALSIIGIKGMRFSTVTWTTGAPADVAACGANRKLFDFPFTPPAGATNVFYNILPIEAAGVTFTIKQTPTLPGTPLQLCVAQGGVWPGTTSVTIKVQYTFS